MSGEKFVHSGINPQQNGDDHSGGNGSHKEIKGVFIAGQGQDQAGKVEPGKNENAKDG